MSEVHTFVTDRLTSASLRQICADRGVKVVETADESAASTPARLPVSTR
jgi:hypothetical protein